MRLQYGHKIHVFRYEGCFDSGEMIHAEFETVELFEKYLNKLVTGKSESQAKVITDGLIIIKGEQVLPKVVEIVKSYKVELT